MTSKARSPYSKSMHIKRIVLVGSLSVLSLNAPVRAALCPGDCNGDGLVEVNELVRGVSIAAGEAAYSLCPPVDTNGDRQVSVDEIVAAVGNALGTCPATTTLFHAPEMWLARAKSVHRPTYVPLRGFSMETLWKE